MVAFSDRSIAVQNRYAGDVGDYVKLAILRHLAVGKRLGVAWWLFPDETNNDGGHVTYLSNAEKWKHLDPELFEGLPAVVKSKNRSVLALQKYLPSDTCFSGEEIPCFEEPYGCRPAKREEWFQRVKTDLNGCNVVFVDPDNGLEPERFAPARSRAGKSIRYGELKALNRVGRTLVVYHHYFRKQHDWQIRTLAERIKLEGFQSVDVLRWRRTSPRAFFLLNASSEMQQRAATIESASKGDITWQQSVA
jgi:hypothetical protein